MFKIGLIVSPMDSTYTFKQANEWIQTQFNGDITVDIVNSYSLDSDLEARAEHFKAFEKVDIIFILMHGGLTQFKCFDLLMEAFEGRKKMFIRSGCEDENTVMLERSGLSPREYTDILKYILSSSAENSLRLYTYLAVYYGKMDIDIQEPVPLVWEGIYLPGKAEADPAAYLLQIEQCYKPVVGILMYSRYVHENNTAHIDALIKAVEDLGGFPLPIFTASAPEPAIGCKGVQWVVDNWLMSGGKSRIDALINTMSFSQSILSSPGSGGQMVDNSIFEPLGVAVLQAMSTYQSQKDWETNLRGVDMMSFTGSVYYPEFDGQIITVTYACAQLVKDDIGEKIVFNPIPERANRIARLAYNWALLRKIPNTEKKIAILFHNMPPRNDMIGCAFGIDTPQSVYLMVEALKQQGFCTEYPFENGDDIINRIIDAVSNDTRWLSAEQALERSVGTIAGDEYRQWFAQLTETVQSQLQRDWGRPPGEVMVHEDNMPVPGILNGNIFIGLQPPRGYEEKADEVYHSTDIVPPHQYMAYYKWIKEIFKANVVVHVGTHGTLEWLPGKEIGLSENCYPDIIIDDLPHLYPYSITVVGEGIQAKRRSDAVILDYLIPALMPGGTYDEMEVLDGLIKQYYQARQIDPGKVQWLQQQIVEAVVKCEFHKDLNTTPEAIEADFATFMEQMHGWMEEVKNTLIKDGLHIYGTVPQAERLHSLICALLRLPNGTVPSLIQGACRASGQDYEHLKDYPHQLDAKGRTNLMRLEEMENLSRGCMAQLMEGGFEKAQIPSIIATHFPEAKEADSQELAAVLNFTVDTVMPKLECTTDEMTHFVAGVNGQFVPPGSGGAPTRGKVNILPTGRNFYSIDPAAVPSRASWQVGVQLGDQLIERYVKDNNTFPETVAIVVYAGETMKTSGDDIAEILYLMGIKPKWLEQTDKVIGLEVIPLEELTRPRVDVTLRVSGLFRDTFPNLIERVEEAVNLAAGLEEPEEHNAIKRNFNQELKALIENGEPVETAQQQAGMRIFSDPPGTYGAGVDMLINSKNWESVSDLGNIYTFWGGHAYGKNIHGEKAQAVFARRLAAAQITVKNESSMEIDMLESDDFYNYHGGLIAAVRTHSGQKPSAYCGDTSDPTRVKTNDVWEQSAKIMRARILNPKWFEGLQQHGYKGAQEVSGMMDFVFGWDATADIIEDWMYEKITEHFLLNDQRREWMRQVNPWAVHNMVERLLEAQQRGMWNAKQEQLEQLRALYVSVEGDIEEHI